MYTDKMPPKKHAKSSLMKKPGVATSMPLKNKKERFSRVVEQLKSAEDKIQRISIVNSFGDAFPHEQAFVSLLRSIISKDLTDQTMMELFKILDNFGLDKQALSRFAANYNRQVDNKVNIIRPRGEVVVESMTEF
ncbi:MAG: hypothetical protein EBV19_07860, partial [Flavobacteriia bacterium]|nr:hypothetical protein [Flavobacteriia bacterium]